MSLKAFSFTVSLTEVVVASQELSVYKVKRPLDALPFQCSVNITKYHLSMAVLCFYSHSLEVRIWSLGVRVLPSSQELHLCCLPFVMLFAVAQPISSLALMSWSSSAPKPSRHTHLSLEHFYRALDTAVLGQDSLCFSWPTRTIPPDSAFLFSLLVTSRSLVYHFPHTALALLIISNVHLIFPASLQTAQR